MFWKDVWRTELQIIEIKLLLTSDLPTVMKNEFLIKLLRFCALSMFFRRNWHWKNVATRCSWLRMSFQYVEMRWRTTDGVPVWWKSFTIFWSNCDFHNYYQLREKEKLFWVKFSENFYGAKFIHYLIACVFIIIASLKHLNLKLCKKKENLFQRNIP